METSSTRHTEWRELVRELEDRFGEDLDLDAILFLIGLQELGMGGHRRYNKDQKLDVLHIGVCTVLLPYGYYEYKGRDEEDWPHFERTQRLPSLKPMEQEKLMKEAIVSYFRTG